MIEARPAKLEGHGVRLEPLSREHEQGLIEAAQDGKLWELFFTSVPRPEKAGKYIDDAESIREGRLGWLWRHDREA